MMDEAERQAKLTAIVEGTAEKFHTRCEDPNCEGPSAHLERARHVVLDVMRPAIARAFEDGRLP